MSGNFGPIAVKFFHPETLAARITNPLYAISASGTSLLSRIGNGEIELGLDQMASLPVGYPEILEDDIAVAWTNELIPSSVNRKICTFKIKKRIKGTSKRGISTLKLSGPDLLSELNDYLHFFAIGATFDTTLGLTGFNGTTQITLTSIADIETTLQQQAHIGEEEIQVALADLANFADGDEIVIPLGDGQIGSGNHFTKVKNVALSEDELYTTLTIEDAMPDEANGGNTVYIPRVFQGDTIRIKKNGAGYHEAHIVNDQPAANDIEIFPPMAETINGGNVVEIISGKELLTSGDITAVMKPATDAGWTLTGTTSTKGSAYRPNGAKISEMLIDTAQKSGDYFYLAQPDPTVPSRSLIWKTSSPSSSITLENGSVYNVNTRYLLWYKGIIDEFEDYGETNLVSEITGTVADPTIHLGMATTIDPDFPIYYARGAYVVQNKALSSGGDGIYHVHRNVSFNDIEPVSNSEAAKIVAAQELYDACKEYLEDHVDSNHYYGAACTLHAEVYPGESMAVAYAETNWNFSGTGYISEIKISVSSRKGGARVHDLTLSDKSPRELFTASQNLMKAFQGGTLTAGGTGGTGGTGGGDVYITDHGELTGLADDDHSQYALLAGRDGDILIIDQIRAFDNSGLKLYEDGGAGIFIQDGGQVGIGTSSPGAILHVKTGAAATIPEIVQGAASQTANLTSWRNSADAVLAYVDKNGIANFNAGTDTTNTFIGNNAGKSDTTGTGLVGIGNNALSAVTTGYNLLALGTNALQRVTTGSNNMAIGPAAARFQTGSSIVAVGSQALYGVDGLSTGGKNTSIGASSGFAIRTGEKNVFIGYLAGSSNVTGSGNVFIGNQAGQNETGSNKLYIENTSGAVSLIYGEFDNDLVQINGELFIDGDLEFIGPQTISTNSGDLTIAPAGGTLINGNVAIGSATNLNQAAIKAAPMVGSDYALYLVQRSDQTASIVRFEDSSGSALLLLTKDGDLESGQPGFTSGLTGWQIDHLGNAEFNNLVARGEFHASVFVADEMHAAGGTLAIMSMGVLHSNATLPAVIGNTFTVNIKASIDTGLCPFAIDDIFRMKYMVHDGTSLDIWDVYAEVDAQGTLTGRDLTKSEPGYYPMTCRWRLGGKAALTIPALTAAVKWGEVAGGAGTYTGGLILTSDLSQAPYIDVFTLPADHVWAGVAPIPTPRVRMGNLDGVLGLSEQWGIAMGKDLSDTTLDAPYIVASDLQLKLNNVAISIFDSSNNQRISIEPDGDIFAGTDITSPTTTTFYHQGSTGFIRIGPTGAVGKGNIYWDGSALRIRNNTTTVINLASDGNSYFTGVMLIDTAGYIRQGTGTWGSTFNGIAISNESGIGTFSSYKAGSKVTWLDNNGITIESPNSGSHASYRAYKFINAAGTELGGVYSRHSTASGTQNIYIHTNPNSGYDSTLGLYSYGGANDDADVFLAAQGNNYTSTAVYIQIQSNNGNTGNSITATGAPFLIAEGLVVGQTDPADSLGVGSIVLDQGALDTSILACKSSDMNDANQGMVDANTYFQIKKIDGATGGSLLRGASSLSNAVQLIGSAPTGVTTKSTSASALIELRGYINSGGAASANNIVAIANGNTKRWFMQGDGGVYMDTVDNENNFDEHDDVSLVRAAAKAIGGGIIHDRWDNFVKHNREDLDRLDIVTKEGFMHSQNIIKLYAGAIWQLNKRLSQLEELINGNR